MACLCGNAPLQYIPAYGACGEMKSLPLVDNRGDLVLIIVEFQNRRVELPIGATMLYGGPAEGNTDAIVVAASVGDVCG